MLFWWICGEKVFSPSYSSAILAPPSMVSFKYLKQFDFPLDKADFITFFFFGGRLLYNIVLVFHILTWIRHGCTHVPHPESPSHLPPHSIPLGHPSAPAPSTLYHASNLDWWSISHMIIYMFQCHSPKSSHPRPLPQSPKDCSIHLCLFYNLNELGRSDIFSIHQEKTLRRIYRIITFYFQSVFYLTYNFLTFS